MAECPWWVWLGQVKTSMGWNSEWVRLGFKKINLRPTLNWTKLALLDRRPALLTTLNDGWPTVAKFFYVQICVGKNRSRELYHSPFEVICHPYDRTRTRCRPTQKLNAEYEQQMTIVVNCWQHLVTSVGCLCTCVQRAYGSKPPTPFVRFVVDLLNNLSTDVYRCRCGQQSSTSNHALLTAFNDGQAAAARVTRAKTGHVNPTMPPWGDLSSVGLR